MKTNAKRQIIPIDVFAKAALKLFKCKPEDIDTSMIFENKEAIVLYQGDTYRISTREALRETVREMLNDRDFAHHIAFSCWLRQRKALWI